MKDVQVWSCGGGTQSGAIASLIGTGELPRPDYALMINTGREKLGTRPFVDGFIRPALAKVGLELTIVNKSDFASVDLFAHNGDILVPGFTNISGTVGKLEPYCSGEWKTRVGQRWLRSIGVETATVWLGISIDEMRRVRSQRLNWLTLSYPLIFIVRYTRSKCVERIRADGWLGEIPHSACWMSPNMSDSEWLEMKTSYPADFASACDLEIEVQKVDPHFWLHPSCVPLASVDFTAQFSMFSDRGCTTGCFT